MIPLTRVLAAVRSHPNAAALAVVLAAAIAMRLAFAFRAPPFYVGGDSPTYLDPAVQLLQGQGFDPIVKRPPGYPLFLAASLASFGFDLQAVLLAQHLLGILTSAAAYAIGRLAFGRAAGVFAGLLTALNGPLLIFEHYIMAETLFTCLLTLAVAATLWGARHPRSHALTLPLLAAGLLFGLASATRQSAQPLLVLVPLALLLAGAGRRRLLSGTTAALAGFLVVLLPWLAFDYARNQTLSSATLGETLIWRLTRSGPDDFFEWSLPRAADEREQDMRKFVFNQAADRELPSDTKVAAQKRFGLTEAEADRLMRSIALEAIARQPDRYLASSTGLFHEHLLGSQQWMGGQGKEGGVTRYVDAITKYGSWWSARVRPLIVNATPGQEQEFRRAQAIVNLYQPYHFGAPLLALLALGLAAAVVVPAWRLGLVPIAGAAVLLLLAAFLAGDLPRYRYPADPLLAVAQAGGLVWLAGLARPLLEWRAVRRAGRRRPGPDPGGPGAFGARAPGPSAHSGPGTQPAIIGPRRD